MNSYGENQVERIESTWLPCLNEINSTSVCTYPHAKGSLTCYHSHEPYVLEIMCKNNWSKYDEWFEREKIKFCLLEKEFLPSIFNIMIHLMVQLVVKVEFCGPPYAYSMDVPHERYTWSHWILLFTTWKGPREAWVKVT